LQKSGLLISKKKLSFDRGQTDRVTTPTRVMDSAAAAGVTHAARLVDALANSWWRDNKRSHYGSRWILNPNPNRWSWPWPMIFTFNPRHGRIGLFPGPSEATGHDAIAYNMDQELSFQWGPGTVIALRYFRCGHSLSINPLMHKVANMVT